mmetsp:Transcript_122701/g.382006  ORF Transcript_122701/g.382006 Transcript_122701/m.382006 type:complete len:208 (+) Transcript_122701:680-1303(+)
MGTPLFCDKTARSWRRQPLVLYLSASPKVYVVMTSTPSSMAILRKPTRFSKYAASYFSEKPAYTASAKPPGHTTTLSLAGPSRVRRRILRIVSAFASVALSRYISPWSAMNCTAGAKQRFTSKPSMAFKPVEKPQSDGSVAEGTSSRPSQLNQEQRRMPCGWCAMMYCLFLSYGSRLARMKRGCRLEPNWIARCTAVFQASVRRRSQ